MTTKINQIDPDIAAARADWQLVRDMIAGSRTVKAAGPIYLPRDPGSTNSEYENQKMRTPFFPATARTLEGILGLMLRKSATIDAPDAVAPCLDVITPDGMSIDDLYEYLDRETLITNFTGVFVDPPAEIAPPGTSPTDAIDEGYRPFISVYPAETILGIETKIVRNTVRISRVRLEETARKIRELVLIDGIYTVNVWEKADKARDFAIVETHIPELNGEPLTEIPFDLVKIGGTGLKPAPSFLCKLAELNAQHYIASSNIAMCDYWHSAPVPYVAGADLPEGLSIAPNQLWKFSKETVKLGYLEFSGSGMDQLRQSKYDIEAAMVAVGSRLLASEKLAAESAETVAIRRSSENATLAALAKQIGRKLNNGPLKWLALWLNSEPIIYTPSVDFMPLPMTAGEMAELTKIRMNGDLSQETYWKLLLLGEQLDENFDAREEAARLDDEMLDTPSDEI
jgi:hypothetical protein